MTHVFTWSTCLHRSHVDHFLVTALQSVFCGPSSLVAPSASTDPAVLRLYPRYTSEELGPSRARSTWLHRKAERFHRPPHGVYSHCLYTGTHRSHSQPTPSAHCLYTGTRRSHSRECCRGQRVWLRTRLKWIDSSTPMFTA